jgi:hypothetical protein
VAIVLVQSAITIVTGVNNTTLAFDVNLTAGNLICVSHSHFSSPARAITTPVDTLTHTYVPMTAEQAVGDIKLRSFYVENCSGGANTVTFDIDNTTLGDLTVVIAEFSGIVTSGALDQTALFGASGTPITSDLSGTTAQADELLWGAVAHDGSDRTITPGASYTIVEENEGGSSNMPIAVEYQIVAATDEYEATWTFSNSAVNWLVHLATFKAAAAAGGIAIPVVGRQYRERRS